MLPKGSAEPGPFRPERAPWVIAITDAADSGRAKTVVGITGAQSSKTDGVQMSLIGKKLDDDPAPILYIAPTRNFVERVMSPRLAAMIRESSTLAKKKKPGRHPKTQIEIAGTKVRLAWANSATELAGDPAAIVLLDERDRMPNDIAGEGDPKELADARHSTYPDGVTVVTSTPTTGSTDAKLDLNTGLEHWEVSADGVQSPTWQLWQEGTRHEWAWPCPSCRDYFIPRFKLLWWPKKCGAQRALTEARVTCPHCGDQAQESNKAWMNSRAVFVAPGQKIAPNDDDTVMIVNDDGSEVVTKFHGYVLPSNTGDSITFWVSGLCSPWRSFGQRAAAFITASHSGEPERIQAVINTGFGELFRVTGDAPEWEAVQLCEAKHDAGDVPAWAIMLTSGVDVHKDRLNYVIRAWAEDNEDRRSILIEKGEFYGPTDQDDVWRQLDKLLDRQWGGMEIAKMAIDSGYRKDEVYSFCLDHKPRAIPTKGHDRLDKAYYASKVEVTPTGKTRKYGLQLWHVDSDIAKSWVHSRIEWDKSKPGAWFVYRDIDEDYCKQLVAEQRVAKPSGAVVWIQTSKDNHFLDCESLAYIAMRIRGGVHDTRTDADLAAKREAVMMPRTVIQARDPYLD